MSRHEIAVFGAGPAGLSTAQRLSELGHSVTVFTPEAKNQPRPIYTTDTENSEHLARAVPENLRRRLQYLRMITPVADFTIDAGSSYFVLDYPQALDRMESQLDSNVSVKRVQRRWLKETRVVDSPGSVTIFMGGDKIETEAVVDCTGIDANIVSQVKPNHDDPNPLQEYIFGAVIRGQMEREALIMTTGQAGGSCWINPNGKENLDVVFSCWGWKSDYPKFLKSAPARLNVLLKFLTENNVQIDNFKPEYIYQGRISSQPNKNRNGLHSVYSVGESARMPKPLWGDSFRRAVVGGSIVADSIHEGLTPQQATRKWQSAWRGDVTYFAQALVRLSSQRVNDLGGLTNKIIQLSARGDRDWLQKDAEDWIVRRKLSPRLLVTLLSESEFREFLFKTYKTQLKYSLMGDKMINKEWTLPDVSHTELA